MKSNRGGLIGVVRGMITASLTRRAGAATLLLSVGLLVAACGSKNPAAAPTTTVTITAHPSASATTPASGLPQSPTSQPTQASQAPGGAPACPTRYLSARIGPSGGAAGSVYTNIDFTNISSTTCTLYGYPGVVLAGGTPVSPIGQSAAEDPTTPRQLVTLAPGAIASALLRIVQAANYPTARCHPTKTTHLQIIPPNQKTPIFLPYAATACASAVNILTIDVVKPGPGTA
jgi:hypothetical protein